MARPIARLLALPRADRMMLLEAAAYLACMRIALTLLPFRVLMKACGQYLGETSISLPQEHAPIVQRVAWSVTAAGRYAPWKSTCLIEALTAQRLLRRRNISSTLYLGVRLRHPDPMMAHAWLRSGSHLVTGGEPRKGFTVLAKFSQHTTLSCRATCNSLDNPNESKGE